MPTNNVPNEIRPFVLLIKQALKKRRLWHVEFQYAEAEAGSYMPYGFCSDKNAITFPGHTNKFWKLSYAAKEPDPCCVQIKCCTRHVHTVPVPMPSTEKCTLEVVQADTMTEMPLTQHEHKTLCRALNQLFARRECKQQEARSKRIAREQAKLGRLETKLEQIFGGVV
ncbi:MAG: hypothetical protein WC505_06100 [Patescibacteria group bacterium]